MKKVTGYILDNGEFVEDLQEAIEREKELTVESKLRAFCESKMTRDMSYNMVADELLENIEELREILKKDEPIFSQDELEAIKDDVEQVIETCDVPVTDLLAIRRSILEKIKRT